MRLGWRGVAGVDRVAESVEFFVEHAGKSECSLRAFRLDLNKLLLDVGHFVIEIIGRGERGFQARIIFEPFVE